MLEVTSKSKTTKCCNLDEYQVYAEKEFLAEEPGSYAFPKCKVGFAA